MMKKLLVANWKMHPETPREAKLLAHKLKALAARHRQHTIAVCPPAVFLGLLACLPAGRAGTGGKLLWGAQDVSLTRGVGAYTGEVSASQARYAGATLTIIGHSERRALGETDETINQKIKNALAARLKPVICLGETERDESGQYLAPLERQIRGALAGLKKTDFKNMIIAYEPVWAVGKAAQRADTPEDFFRHAIFIRKVISDLFGKKVAMNTPVLYGGSVDSKNAASFLVQGQADGLLIGRASLKPDEFKKIIHATSH
ncbi:MAG: triose-phosphate isomerase [Candidatus Vogelbacteria bacterium GWA1_51_14]|uniref:Triosephosphate isomerase n=1 Tax=Candidatus Vogelbacteria bacterium GWA1_51_14 TaxID=1802435 RepID=A0A1G2QAB7_9BACT|nr:MAG: triose-phosphate isomerase [Candidatus Vogelbacteria bacterium GWA1_51_14]